MIPGVVHLTSKTIYGFTARNHPLYLFKPLDVSLPDMLVGSSEPDRTKNILALANVLEELRNPPRGFIIRVLGKCGDKHAEEEAILYRYCPERWKKTDDVLPPVHATRKLIDVPFTVNIDPPGCTDIDDCISIWQETTKTMVAITIADVHAWVMSNRWVEEKASAIGQTFYKDGAQQVSMLPPHLSDMCSLFPNQSRLGLALIFEWEGIYPTNVKFKPVRIINKESHTYESIMTSSFPIDTLQRIASTLAGTEVTDSHQWVEQLMLFYNKIAAGYLNTAGSGIYRGHTPPDAEKLEKYAIKHLAYSSGIYSHDPLPHWGLNYDVYCHASSPIRRWSDVVNQGVIKYSKVLLSDPAHLNIVCSNAKKYERDVFFIGCLFSGKKPVEGIVLDTNEKRSRVWIEQWKRIITVRSVIPEGTRCTISYYLDMNAPTWKKRMVFKCEGTVSREQPNPALSSVECHASTQAAQDRSTLCSE